MLGRSTRGSRQPARLRRPRRPVGTLATSATAAAVLCLGGTAVAAQSPALASPASRLTTTLAGSASDEVKGCPTNGGTLRVDLDEDVLPDLDPSYSPQAAAYRVFRGVFDSLVYEDSKGKFSPWLATKWAANPTDTSYTFTIRHGVKFTDGTPLNAAAVKYTFDRIENPKEGSLFAISLLGPYKDSVVNSPYRVTVNFSTPYPNFLEAASQAFLGIVSPTAATKEGFAGFGQRPIGSGPFEITSNVANQQITEVRNPAYHWGPEGLAHQGPACLSGINFTEVPEPSTRIGQLTKDQVDAAETILPPYYQTALKDSALDLHVVPGAGAVYQYEINTQDAPWNNADMRIALRDSINLPAILKAVYQGEYTRAWGTISPTTADYDPGVQNSWTYNAKKADSMLAAQGWVMGSDGYRHKDGKTLSIAFVGASPDRELRQEVSVYVQSYLKAVGIDETITNYTGLSGLSIIDSANYGMSSTSFITASPSIIYDFFDSTQIPVKSKSGDNQSRLDDPTVNRWLAAANSATNPVTAKEYWDQVQQYVTKNAVVIPIELEPFILATTSKVHGLAFDRRDYPMYYGAWLQQ